MKEKSKINDLDDYYPDEHCCSAHDDGNGYCEICGAAIYGTPAYYDTYGGEYPERASDYYEDYDE